MRCSKCSSDNREGRKFCANCGAALSISCAKCRAANQPEERFCGECGAPLQVAAAGPAVPEASTPMGDAARPPVAANTPPEGERKTITALFADIKGSTELMRELDPEEARTIIDPVLQLMMDAVHRYGGYVVQSTGDGVFAMFGAPVAHEDHPQRALHAGLTIQQELQDYRERLKEQARPVEARIGVNTGEVVLRIVNTGGHTEYSPVGHVANLAARMQTVAPAGSIVITEECRRLVEGYFSLRALGPTEIKGIDEPVNVYEVIGPGPLRGHFELAAQRGLTRFVGRERELAELQRALQFAIGGQGQIVAVLADAGTGKSRLFHEFKATLPDGCKLLEAYSVSHGTASAWLPVLELLRGFFGIENEVEPASRRNKVRAKLMMLDPALSEVALYLLGLLGIQEDPDPLAQMDAAIRRQRTLEGIKRIILRESMDQPVVLIFEDLHWIDGETQALLDLLADAIGNTRILLLVNYRPEYHHIWANESCYSQLSLDALDRQSAEQMLAALLTDSAEFSPLKRLIIERSGGNPFFIEEMVQALFDEGILARNGAIRIIQPLSQLRLPPTVQGILASRIDRLPADCKQLLQILAVVGRESPRPLIRQLSSYSEAQLDRMLAHLQTAEFIYEQPAPGGAQHAFKHALTQEITYNSLLITQRMALHERAAQVIEELYADTLDDHLGELARHYSHSANLERAVEYLGRSGQQVMQRSANHDAIRSLSAAIDLIPRLPDSSQRIQQELPIQLALGAALVAVKGWATADVERVYTRARELCGQLSDPPELFPVLFGLWAMYFLRADMRTAHEHAEHLLRRAQSMQEPTPLMFAYQALGDTSFQMGHLLRARKCLETAVSLYDRESHGPLAFRFTGLDSAVNCLSYGAHTLWALGYPDQALQRGNEAVALAQGLSHPHSLAFAGHMFGILRQLRREPAAAQETAESVIALSSEQGFSFWLAWGNNARGEALIEQGRGEEGIAQMQEALASIEAIGTGLSWPWNLCLLAKGYAETDSLDEGLGAVAEALAVADEHEDRFYDAEIYRVKGDLLLRQDASNFLKAEGCFRQAIEIARDQGAKSWELRATTSLARVLQDNGRRDEARSMLADIYNWFTEGFNTADLKNAKALLDELSN
jgi:class 3 adenylate cyclase/predicted ATPase